MLMLFNTYEPGKFAFSQESIDIYDLNQDGDLNQSSGEGLNQGCADFNKSKKLSLSPSSESRSWA